MDRIESYPEIIENIINEYADISSPYDNLSQKAIFDRQRNSYLLVVFGHENRKLVHYAMIHVDIVDGKFWIRYDGTEDGIATHLLEKGVPKEHIVLAFKSPELRKYTDFAVA